MTTQPSFIIVDGELTIQPADFQDALASAAARRPGDFDPGVGCPAQARASRCHGADADVSDLAGLLATT
jgi:hypothetical protein